MTYNLKFPTETGPNAWSVRRPLVAETIGKVAPALFGTQEGHYLQLRQIAADTSYEWIGLGREGGSHGEFAAVFYDPAVLEPLEYDHFWISQTPDRVGSRSWGTNVVRMATWVRFRTGAGELVLLNTHLDHESEQARVEGARLLAAQVGRFAVPVVVTGDFNCAAGRSAAFAELTGGTGLLDVWGPGGGPDCGTYGGWKAPEAGGGRIDWILTRGLEVTGAGICDHHAGAQWPSDHVPAWADVRV